jgi:hypothetical protein
VRRQDVAAHYKCRTVSGMVIIMSGVGEKLLGELQWERCNAEVMQAVFA